MKNNQQVAYDKAIDTLTNIAEKRIKPFYMTASVAKSCLEEIKRILADEGYGIFLETDALNVSEDFKIAQEFVKKFIKQPDWARTVELSRYVTKDGTNMSLWALTIKTQFATHDMIDWLDDTVITHSVSEEGIEIFIKLKVSTGLESVYLTKTTKE